MSEEWVRSSSRRIVLTHTGTRYDNDRSTLLPGACENNLGAVEMSLKNYSSSEAHYMKSIEYIHKIIADHETKEADKATGQRLQRTLSDRRGNLAVLYIEMKRYPEAFSLLESQLLDDKRNQYIRGCVVKQGILGHYYLGNPSLIDYALDVIL